MAPFRFIYCSTLLIILMQFRRALVVGAGGANDFSTKKTNSKAGYHHSPTPYPVLNDDKQLQEGQLNYNLVVRDSQMPRYGSCWKDGLKLLDSGCKHLTDDVQRSLALHFANCFLEKAGQETYPCDDGTEISVCLSKMNTNGFTAVL